SAGVSIELLPRQRSLITDLDAAVTALHRVSPLGKRNLLLACAEVAGADGSLDVDEADLLRALAELWDCPIPLVLAPDGQPLRAAVTG
ncbi:MAG: TerB family tellurite resistance protein, partial [Planctomycetes bacterium]|nr:TerB family tellurite resistance protein [Planctomycetota bacterium]